MKVTRTKLSLEKMLKLTKSFNKELTVIQSFVNETNDELRNRTKAKLPRDFHEELEWIEVRRYICISFLFTLLAGTQKVYYM